MDPIGCGELAELVEGTLRFGAMPPLGGSWEPVGRVTTCCECVTPGDVYWAVETEEQGAHRLMEAFCRGARGAVSQLADAPAFDGSFLITVDDALETLCQFGRWRRTNYEGKLAVIGPALGARQVVGFFHADDNDPASVHRVGEIQGICSAAESLTTLAARDFSVFSLSPESLSDFDEISHLCCPHVICINSLPSGKPTRTEPANHHEQVLAGTEGVPDDVCLVYVDVKQQTVTLQRSSVVELLDNVDWKSVLPTLPSAQHAVALACWGVARALEY